MLPTAFTQYRPAVSDAELQAILELQQRNLKGVLSPEEQLKEGFVTLSHTLPLLQKMQAACPQIVAVRNGNVVGYALCLHPELAAEVPLLGPMFERIQNKLGAKADYRVMGQICIDKSARGQGVFRKLYQCLQEHCSPLPIITEVAENNRRSLQAHQAIGFRLLETHKEGDTNWHVVIWP